MALKEVKGLKGRGSDLSANPTLSLEDGNLTFMYLFDIVASQSPYKLTSHSFYKNACLKVFFHLRFVLFPLFYSGLYEVNVIRTEDSDRLQLEGNYLMTVRKEYLCLHCARTGKRVLEWELDHLPRFRLQRLSHLQDLDKVLTFQAAR